MKRNCLKSAKLRFPIKVYLPLGKTILNGDFIISFRESIKLNVSDRKEGKKLLTQEILNLSRQDCNCTHYLLLAFFKLRQCLNLKRRKTRLDFQRNSKNIQFQSFSKIFSELIIFFYSMKIEFSMFGKRQDEESSFGGISFETICS